MGEQSINIPVKAVGLNVPNFGCDLWIYATCLKAAKFKGDALPSNTS